ncbi:GNAT family N-acetyltransferase [Brevibacillus borstelensis]|uniref:GNAT family N-acetyltransferase n=1 Tax=Brevibacillus borstelensis TaxID=45462 RepID=UPI00203E285E|nr:GNAT family N-acetyltransferase [Brevibacillus borstelensis]MCM3592608.1 GNAT family N-acetyltransferase [Brevibacillus borstelensis]WNF04754.1 GNAT family N-acetyltransferase [Brevibacillus borstelensis]
MTVSKRHELRLDELASGDIPGLIELSASVGWDYHEAELATLIAAGRVFGHRDDQGKVYSSAAIVPYGETLASIGMVIVHPECRGMGLGKQVTQACIDAASTSADTALMLIATPEGKPMYESMGFVSVDCVHKYLCEAYQRHRASFDTGDTFVEKLTGEHLEQIVELDKAAVGADRRRFLIHRIQQAQNGVVLKRQDGAVIGYGLSVEGPVNLILGPIVAFDLQGAKQIVEQLASGYQGKLRIDVPSGHEEFLVFLEQCGFQKASQPPIMIRNAEKLPERNGRLYAIAAQAFG